MDESKCMALLRHMIDAIDYDCLSWSQYRDVSTHILVMLPVMLRTRMKMVAEPGHYILTDSNGWLALFRCLFLLAMPIEAAKLIGETNKDTMDVRIQTDTDILSRLVAITVEHEQDSMATNTAYCYAMAEIYQHRRRLGASPQLVRKSMHDALRWANPLALELCCRQLERGQAREQTSNDSPNNYVFILARLQKLYEIEQNTNHNEMPRLFIDDTKMVAADGGIEPHLSIDLPSLYDHVLNHCIMEKNESQDDDKDNIRSSSPSSPSSQVVHLLLEQQREIMSLRLIRTLGLHGVLDTLVGDYLAFSRKS